MECENIFPLTDNPNMNHLVLVLEINKHKHISGFS